MTLWLKLVVAAAVKSDSLVEWSLNLLFENELTRPVVKSFGSTNRYEVSPPNS